MTKKLEGLMSTNNYLATPEGLIWSIKTKRFLKPSDNGNGYQHVVLRLYNKSVDVYVHRFIAENLIDNPDDLPEVNHINGLKWDNRVENLEWVSSSSNKKHAFEIGLKKFKRVHCHSQVTGRDSYFDSAKDAANYFCWPISSIRSACNGQKTNEYMLHIWRYVE